jgi:hypothetical protein
MIIEPHPAHMFPTAGRLRRLIDVFVSCRRSPPPPLGGRLAEQGSGIVVIASASSPCRVVVA